MKSPSSPTDVSTILSMETKGDDVHVTLIETGCAPIHGCLPLDRLEETARETRELLKPGSGLLIPGDDGDAVAREVRAAACLLDLFHGPDMRAIHARLGQLAGKAELIERPIVLAIDAQSETPRLLPWELLESSPPGSIVGQHCRVLRITSSPDTPREWSGAQTIDVLLWSPIPDDPICSRVHSSLLENLEAVPTLRVRTITPDTPPTPPSSPFQVFHIITHGVHALDRIELRTGPDRSLAPESALRRLEPWLSTTDLLVLDVCNGSGADVDMYHSPAWRMVKWGIPACLAPRTAYSVEASLRVSPAFYNALARGETLLECVAAGRRVLREMGLAHPICRWWNPSLLVGRLSLAAQSAVRPRVRRPDGWPLPAPDLEAPLQKAWKLAREHGFFGIEHLAQGIALATQDIPRFSALAQHLMALGSRASGYTLEPNENPRITPRLLALGHDLEPGFDLDQLLAAILRIGWVEDALPPTLVRSILRQSKPASRETLKLEAVVPENLDRDPCLEVEGGPDDGMLIRLDRKNMLIGRIDASADPRADVEFYAQPGPEDPTVSRRHLRYLGDGRLEPLGSTKLQRPGHAPIPVHAPFQVRHQDLLCLGDSTRLRVIICPKKEKPTDPCPHIDS